MRLPRHRDLFYGGDWHARARWLSRRRSIPRPAKASARAREADAADVDAAARAAHAGVPRVARHARRSSAAAVLRAIAATLREHADELALIDAREWRQSGGRDDARRARGRARSSNTSPGLAGEVKGETIPMGDGAVNMTLREPFGVVRADRRVQPSADVHGGEDGRAARRRQHGDHEAAAAGAAVGVPDDGAHRRRRAAGRAQRRHRRRECGEALVAHPLDAAPRADRQRADRTRDRARRRRAAQARDARARRQERVRRSIPDADVDKAIAGAVAGMNFTWCGQSCGSTSRVFVHASVHDRVVAGIVAAVQRFKPGLPTDRATTMGAIVRKAQLDKVERYIAVGRGEGATLACGGARPRDAQLASGYFIAPTVFTGVTQPMRIANEEIFGPVLCVLSVDRRGAHAGATSTPSSTA